MSEYEQFTVGKWVWCWTRQLWGIIEEIDRNSEFPYLVNFCDIRRGYHSASEITDLTEIPPRPVTKRIVLKEWGNE